MPDFQRCKHICWGLGYDIWFFDVFFFASKPASPEAICQAHGQDLEDCEPDGGSCPCHRPEGAKACEVPNVLTEKNHKNVSQLLFLFFFWGWGGGGGGVGVSRLAQNIQIVQQPWPIPWQQYNLQNLKATLPIKQYMLDSRCRWWIGGVLLSL